MRLAEYGCTLEVFAWQLELGSPKNQPRGMLQRKLLSNGEWFSGHCNIKSNIAVQVRFIVPGQLMLVQLQVVYLGGYSINFFKLNYQHPVISRAADILALGKCECPKQMLANSGPSEEIMNVFCTKNCKPSAM